MNKYINNEKSLNISNCLTNLLISIRTYIDKNEISIAHLSENLIQIENTIYENKDNKIKTYVGDIIVELQNQDIIQQELEHLVSAIEEVVVVLKKYPLLKLDELQADIPDEFSNEYQHILTLLSFILKNTETQINRINIEIETIIKFISNKIVKITDSISRNKLLNKQLFKLVDTIKDLLQQIKQEQIDMNNKIEGYTQVSLHITNLLKSLGEQITINQCKYKHIIIKHIVQKLTVSNEIDTMLKTFSELEIEKKSEENITLF